MQPIEFIRRFLNDLWHLPLPFQLVLLAGAVSWAWQWHKARQRKELERAARSWPTQRARVVWAQVSDERREGDGPAHWEGILTYSYAFPGQELEVGEHRQKFYDEAVAADWARGLRDRFVIVRVDPANPTFSVWLDEGDSAAAALAAVKADRSLGEELWGGTGHAVVAGAVFAVSGTAALAALWILVSCLKGKPIFTIATNAGAFFGMHVGLIVCLIAAQALSTPGSSRDLSKWFRTTASSVKDSSLLKWVSACYAVLFVYAWIRITARDGDPAFWSTLLFSGGWFAGYLSAAGMCWRALTRTHQNETAN